MSNLIKKDGHDRIILDRSSVNYPLNIDIEVNGLFGDLVNDNLFTKTLINEFVSDDIEAVNSREGEPLPDSKFILCGYLEYMFLPLPKKRATGDFQRDIIPVYLIDTVGDYVFASAILHKNGSVFIAVNKTVLDMVGHVKWWALADAIFAHELGHVLAGHLDSEEHSTVNITTSLPERLKLLIEGGYNLKELQANIVATAILGNDASGLIFLLNKLSYEHKNKGVKLEHIHACFALIEFLKSTKKSPSEIIGLNIDYFSYVHLTEEEKVRYLEKIDYNNLKEGEALGELEE
jgi:predicted heme/steroid binding protein